MTQTPEWPKGSARSAKDRERHFGRNLEQQLLLLPEPLHYDLLDYFCCLNFSQRRSFILEVLNRMGIAHKILRTGKAFHIIVKPDYQLNSRLEDHKLFQAKCFVAHYDRRLQTASANDNSAAVWHLLNLAAQMKRECPLIKTPVQIIFTDHEELRAKEHACEQGAYLLAKYLRNRSPKICHAFFVFDQCGIGDTLCYLPNAIMNRDIQKQQKLILEHVQNNELSQIEIKTIHKYQYYFSDNLGLNLMGYPALLFSTLPQQEVRLWQHSGKKPPSWEASHSESDTPDLLEPHSFALMNQVLSRLCRV